MAKLEYDKDGRLLFTKEMKKEYTILFPMMAKIHFNLMKNIFAKFGYKVALLETEGPEIAQVGLKYVHNDTCYPAILTIGQLIHAVQSGKYDVDKIALPDYSAAAAQNCRCGALRRYDYEPVQSGQTLRG